MKKIFLTGFILLLFLTGLFSYEYFRFNDGKLHVVFCDVGQGDGIFIRTPSEIDIIVDGGPDDSILSCLSSNMPFWDRTIELMFLTHPHADHMRGLFSVLKRYEVLEFGTEKIENDTDLYRELMKAVSSEGLEVRSLYAGDRFKISDGMELKTLGPSKEFLARTSPTGVINESEGFGNLVTLISYGNFKAILTGDSQVEGLKDAVSGNFPIEVLQIPHHGSRFGIDAEIIQKINPKLAVISVGKNNYGHPAPSVLKILSDLGIKTLRTDWHGDIEIIVDKNGSFAVR